MVNEDKPVEFCPEYLTETEAHLFEQLKSGVFKASRQEQERLSADYIYSKLQHWLTE